MDQSAIKRRHRELSKQQAMYVAMRETGASRESSAIFAGYPAGQKAGDQVEESENVQAELEKARGELATSSGITKETVLAGLKKAADDAVTLGDPQAQVRAWAEIGKLLGFYAPEVKKHVHGLDAESRKALSQLPDSELHKLAKGRVIEGEAQRVDE